MVYLTGDTHGDFTRVRLLARVGDTSLEDILVILGDVGINTKGGIVDEKIKFQLSQLSLTLFCIHGNHDARPQTIASYIEKEWNGGRVLFEPKYPNLIFAIDGEVYNFDGLNCIVIGGAYSVDKEDRLQSGNLWWSDEQPSEETKRKIELVLKERSVDVVLSHTCPLEYSPTEAYLEGIDPTTVDMSTEEWLSRIEKTVNYKKWYCGHFHISKFINRLRFIYKEIINLRDDVANFARF